MNPTLISKLEWDVKTAAVRTPEYELPERTALLRSDDNSLLSIVSSKYNIVSNKSFMNLNEMIANSGRFELCGYHEFCNGKKVMAFHREIVLQEFAGHELESHLVVGNSHDGTRQLYVGVANMIVRCENQFYSTAGILNLRHALQIIPDERLVADLVRSYDQGNFSINKTLERFKIIPVTNDNISSLISEIFSQMKYDSTLENKTSINDRPIARKMMTSIDREMSALGKNLYGLFNGITHYTTHNSGSYNKSIYGVNGASARINQIAFNFCKKHLN